MPCRIFLSSPHIHQVHSLVSPPRHQRLQPVRVDILNAVFLSKPVRISLRGGNALFRQIRQFQPVRARLQRIPRQRPARRPVLQPHHIRQAHALQHPRADDAARPSGAVYDHRRIIAHFLGDVGDSQRKLRPGHAAPTGDAQPLVLLRRARIQDDDLLAAVYALLKLHRIDLRHMMHDLHLLAEVLARHIHAPLRRVLLRNPAVDPPVQHRHIRITQPFQRAGSERSPASIVIAQHHRRRRVRHSVRHLRFKVAARYQARARNMSVVVLTRLANINKRERRAALQQRVKVLRRDCRRHVVHLGIFTYFCDGFVCLC